MDMAYVCVGVGVILHEGYKVSDDIENGGELRRHVVDFGYMTLELCQRGDEERRRANEEGCVERIRCGDTDVRVLTSVHRFHVFTLIVTYVREGVV